MDDFLAPLLVVVTTALIQSVFGVGVLLLGTPWLMALGVGFTEALWILLPVSLAISLLQLVTGWLSVDWGTVRDITVWALPTIAIALALTTVFRPPVEVLVAAVVLSVAMMDHSAWMRERVEKLVEKRRAYLVCMGLVHGVSNLGGSLLTAFVHAGLSTKDTARATIAAGYVLFASIQLLTLWVAAAPGAGGLTRTTATVAIGATTFLAVERLSAGRIDSARYRTGLSVLLACAGCLILFRAAFP